MYIYPVSKVIKDRNPDYNPTSYQITIMGLCRGGEGVVADN